MEIVLNKFWEFQRFSIEKVNISFSKELENPQDYFEFYPEYSNNIQVQLYQENDLVQLHMVVDVNHINSYPGYVIHLEVIFEYKLLTSIKFQIGLKFLSEFQMDILNDMQKDANETIQDYILTVTRDMPLKEFIWKYEGAEIVEKGED